MSAVVVFCSRSRRWDRCTPNVTSATSTDSGSSTSCETSLTACWITSLCDTMNDVKSFKRGSLPNSFVVKKSVENVLDKNRREQEDCLGDLEEGWADRDRIWR